MSFKTIGGTMTSYSKCNDSRTKTSDFTIASTYLKNATIDRSRTNDAGLAHALENVNVINMSGCERLILGYKPDK